jgi:hypothetical protein
MRLRAFVAVFVTALVSAGIVVVAGPASSATAAAAGF